MQITSSEIRSKYLEFFRSKQHAVIPSSPLVPENDPSVLFNTAGMQPLVPYLLGQKHPLGKRIADVQKCIRTNDIDDVGDDTHCTFFEMLGNWSLGDYFKNESITMSWEFLTDSKWLGLDPRMISVTVFEGDENAPRDEESATIWKSLGMPVDKIAYLPAEDNWWAAGPTGPCGPDTEIFYWMGEGLPPTGSNKGTDSKMWMEIWNNVFMQYNREYVERVILLDGMYCLFDENFVVNEKILMLIRAHSARVIIVTNAPAEKMLPIAEQTGFEFVTYEKNPIKTDSIYFTKMLAEKGLKASDCIYLDHDAANLESAKQVGIAGELFENELSTDKLSKYFYKLQNLPAQCVDTGMGLERCTVTLNHMKSVYETDLFAPVLARIREIVGESNYNEKSARIIADHTRAATHMIADGVVPKNVDQGYILRRLIRRAIREFYKMGYEQAILSEISRMYIAQFEGIYESVKTNKEKILEELVREEEKFGKTLKDGLKEFDKVFWRPSKPQIDNPQYQDHLLTIQKRWCQFSGKDMFRLFDTYWFPPEMTLELLKEKFNQAILNGSDAKLNEEMILWEFQEEFKKHQELSRTASEGKFKGGLGDQSDETVALHTACHLMLAGLRKVLWDHVHQAGSNITSERLRFDFTHGEKVTPEQLQAVEKYVNSAISANSTMVMTEMDKTEAQRTGVSGSFWEKYPDVVKVYTMTGADGIVYTRELCGGPHVETSANMGTFKIQKEEASSAGVRRIKAILVK